MASDFRDFFIPSFLLNKEGRVREEVFVALPSKNVHSHTFAQIETVLSFSERETTGLRETPVFRPNGRRLGFCELRFVSSPEGFVDRLAFQQLTVAPIRFPRSQDDDFLSLDQRIR